MSDLQVIKRRAVSYTAHGDSSYSDESYIKLSTSFRNGTLRQLQGAPLSAFISVALHEADDPPGVTMAIIADETGVSYRHLLRVMPWLCEHRYCVIAGADTLGNQIYRVAGFAWFGSNDHRASPKKPHSPTGSTNARSSDKMSHARTPNAANVTSVVVVDQDIDPDQFNSEKQQQPTTRARDILAECGITGRSLNALAAIDPEVAGAWAEWIRHAPATVKNPQGVAIMALRNKRDALPPEQFRGTKKSWHDSDSDFFMNHRDAEKIHGTLAHKMWARWNGGCEQCGIKPREQSAEE